jgi:hypothetical protein
MSSSATLALVIDEKDKLHYHTQSNAMMLSEKVVLFDRKCDECWLMGYRARYLTHPPHPTHCAFHSQQVQAS